MLAFLMRSAAWAESGRTVSVWLFAFFRRRAVGLGARLPLQILPRQIPPEIAGQARQLPQDLPRGGIPAVHPLAFPLGIDHQLGHAAGPMKIQVRIEVVLIESLDGGGMCRRATRLLSRLCRCCRNTESTSAGVGGFPEYPTQTGLGVAYEPGQDHPYLIPSAGVPRPGWTSSDLSGSGGKAIALRDLPRFVNTQAIPADPWEIIKLRRRLISAGAREHQRATLQCEPYCDSCRKSGQAMAESALHFG